MRRAAAGPIVRLSVLLILLIWGWCIAVAEEPPDRYELPGRRMDGNRHYPGLLAAQSLASHRLPDTPRWIVGYAAENDRFVWYVETESRLLYRVELNPEGELTVEALGSSEAPPWAPVALLYPAEGGPSLRGSVADLSLPPEATQDTPLLLGAFPARTPDGRTVLLGAPTMRYPHGALGDLVEAASLVVFAAAGDQPMVIPLEDEVAEENGVLLLDVDSDGDPEILTTVANQQQGARIAGYSLDGAAMADGPPVGRGFRWRHLLGGAVFAPGWPGEVVAVRTPHIGGSLEFYRYEDPGRLKIVHEAEGYASHRLGSPVLGQAALVDVDGDGYPEIILPSQRRDRLVVVKRTQGGSTEIGALPLSAPPSSNVGIASSPSWRSAALLIGSDDGTITAWY